VSHSCAYAVALDTLAILMRAQRAEDLLFALASARVEP